MHGLRKAAYGAVTQMRPPTDTLTVTFIAITRYMIRLEGCNALTQTMLRSMETMVWDVFVAVQGFHSTPTSVRRLPVLLPIFRYVHCSALYSCVGQRLTIPLVDMTFDFCEALKRCRVS